MYQCPLNPLVISKKMGYSKEDCRFMRIGRMYSVYIKSALKSEYNTNPLRILPEDLV